MVVSTSGESIWQGPLVILRSMLIIFEKLGCLNILPNFVFLTLVRWTTTATTIYHGQQTVLDNVYQNFMKTLRWWHFLIRIDLFNWHHQTRAKNNIVDCYWNRFPNFKFYNRNRIVFCHILVIQSEESLWSRGFSCFPRPMPAPKPSLAFLHPTTSHDRWFFVAQVIF